MDDVQYRSASRADLPGMAEVYVAAFPDSIRHFFPRRPPPLLAIADLLEVPLAAEPAGVLVAETQGRLAGYCLAPAHISHLARAAVRAGLLRRFLGRWLGARYGLGLDALRRLALDHLRSHYERRGDPHHAEAHILSLAVHPDFQGRGLGRELLRRGLQYLASRGADRIRLEVRPDNLPARRLYEQHGFVTVGQTADSQGAWLIMLRFLPPAEGTCCG